MKNQRTLKLDDLKVKSFKLEVVKGGNNQISMIAPPACSWTVSIIQRPGEVCH